MRSRCFPDRSLQITSVDAFTQKRQLEPITPENRGARYQAGLRLTDVRVSCYRLGPSFLEDSGQGRGESEQFIDSPKHQYGGYRLSSAAAWIRVTAFRMRSRRELPCAWLETQPRALKP